MKTLSSELVILNYNGRHHLEHLLPTAIREAESYGTDCRVVVVDNLSPNDDATWVRENYPSVEVWMAPRNEYLFSYNEFAKQSTADILVFLNNDLKLCENFLTPLLSHFSSPDVFSVGATSLEWEGRSFTCGPAMLKYENGFYSWAYQTDHQKLCHTFFTSGGFMAVDRKKFLKLGGFDILYYPAYCEDVDLCFRAWRRGWRCIFEPKSVVLHRETASWHSAGSRKLKTMNLRNALFFQWSSLTMCKNIWARRKSTFKLIIGGLLKLDPLWLTTYFSALAKWTKIKKNKKSRPANDKEVSKILYRMNQVV